MIRYYLRRWFPVGTRSVLFGVHCFFIHPFFVALAWWKLWGFKDVDDPYVGPVSLKNPRLWLAFFLHDLGYWGKRNMDGPQGERHPYFAAWVMSFLFDRRGSITLTTSSKENSGVYKPMGPWGYFCLCHSRFLSRQLGSQYSALCVADKLVAKIEPAFLYLPRAIASGEIKEYMELAAAKEEGKSKYSGEPPSKYRKMNLKTGSRMDWWRSMSSYCGEWAYEYRDLKPDVHTPHQTSSMVQ